MPKQPHRLLCIVPAARVAAFNTWIRNNLDPSGSDWLTLNLSASGSAPFTHAWFSVQLTDVEFIKVVRRLCAQASISVPADADSYTPQQKKTWLVNKRQDIQTAIGIYIRANVAENWDSPDAALTTLGLKRQVS